MGIYHSINFFWIHLYLSWRHQEPQEWHCLVVLTLLYLDKLLVLEQPLQHVTDVNHRFIF